MSTPKYREYESNPYCLQCFIQWAEATNKALIKSTKLNWKLIEIDLIRCAKSESLKRKIWLPEPERDTRPDGYGYLRYGFLDADEASAYEKYKEKNEMRFCDYSSIISFILHGENSPIENLVSNGHKEINKEKYIPLAMDALKILKLIIKCNVASVDDMWSAQKYPDGKDVSLGQKIQKRMLWIMDGNPKSGLLKDGCIKMLLFLDKMGAKNPICRLYVDEKSNEWQGMYFADMWVAKVANCDLVESMLFYGISPYEIECDSTKNDFDFDNNLCLNAPFAILPYFQRAKAKMKQILHESMNIFLGDCVEIVIEYLFESPSLYKYQRGNLRQKASECMLLMEMVSCKRRKLSYRRRDHDDPNEPTIYRQHICFNTHKNLEFVCKMNGLYEKTEKNCNFWQYFFDLYKEYLLKKVDIMFIFRLIERFSVDLGHHSCEKFHREYLCQIIDSIDYGEYYVVNKKVKDMQYFELFKAYFEQNKLSAGKWGYVKNNAMDKMCGSAFDHHIEKIMKYLLPQKNVFISSDLLGTCVGAKNYRMLALLMKSRQTTNRNCCEAIINWIDPIEHVKVNKKAKFVCDIMDRRIARCENVNQKKVMQRINKWFRRRVRSKNRVYYGNSAGLHSLKREFENVDWRK